MKHRISPAVSYIKNNSKNDQVLTIYDSADGATSHQTPSVERLVNMEFMFTNRSKDGAIMIYLHSFDLGVLLQIENCWESNRELNFSQKK